MSAKSLLSVSTFDISYFEFKSLVTDCKKVFNKLSRQIETGIETIWNYFLVKILNITF